MQPPGTNVCGFYVMENIRIIVNERRKNLRTLRLHDIREEFIPNDRLQALQEELAGFLLKEVIDPKGPFHYPT